MRTVLVVEDDLDCLQAIEIALSAAGHRVLTAAGGPEAIRCLEEDGRPDLILLDLHMPGMDGAQFLDELGRRPALGGIPVVLLSAERDVAAKGAALPVRGYLRKPVDIDALLTVVSA